MSYSFDNFVKRNSWVVKKFSVRKVLPDCKYYVVIVEPRQHANFEFVCKTMLRFTNDEWGLHIFHGNQNESFVKGFFQDNPNVVYTNLNKANLTIEDYNLLLTSVWFYEQIKSSHFLIFQTDSCLLKEGVGEFVQYDYIGAPWPHLKNQVGNGGFSLRSKEFCLLICNTIKRKPRENEDVYFSTNGMKTNSNIASYDVACQFSCEQITTRALPLGVHKQGINYIKLPNLDAVFQNNFAKNMMENKDLKNSSSNSKSINKNNMNILKSNFELHKNKPSDINQHLETLKIYAEQCESILECGVRGVVSSWAFAYGLCLNDKDKKLLFCNDIAPCKLNDLQHECGLHGIELKYKWCSDLDLTFPDDSFDMVFIDTFHVYGQLKRELQLFSKIAKKYIIMHDTTVDAVHGEAKRCRLNTKKLSKETSIPEDEINKGLEPAIKEFLVSHPEWKTKEVFTHNNGLTVLKK